MPQHNRCHLFFHRDFDGICSAAVFLAYAQRRRLLRSSEVELVPVDYEIRKTWACNNLPISTIIVDFLYHPGAEWWFDHHPTTFILADWELAFRPDNQHVWGPSYKSCPRLIIDSIEDAGARRSLLDHFREYTVWSDIVDSAGYSSPRQVVESAEPALQINLSLSVDTSPTYLQFLVTSFQRESLSELAGSDQVRPRFRKAMEWQQDAIANMSRVAELKNGVAFFDLTRKGEAFHRYAPYYLWPGTRFVIAVYRHGGAFKITVSANPWLEFRGPDVGLLCERYGGGGHRQVGAILVAHKRRAINIGREIARITRGEIHYMEQLPFRQQPAKQAQ